MPFDNNRDELEQNLLRAELKDKRENNEADEAVADFDRAIRNKDFSLLWNVYFRVKRMLNK